MVNIHQLLKSLNDKKLIMALDSNSTYNIVDGVRPIQCQNGPGIIVFTADSVTDGTNQDWYISDPNQTLLTCIDLSLSIQATSLSEGADVVTCAIENGSVWCCEEDGSIQLFESGSTSPSGYYLYSQEAGKTNQLVVSKTKQTWTWNKKAMKGGPHR